MAPLRFAAKFDPFLSLDCASPLPLSSTPGAIQEKEGIKFCHLATLSVSSELAFSSGERRYSWRNGEEEEEEEGGEEVAGVVWSSPR